MNKPFDIKPDILNYLSIAEQEELRRLITNYSTFKLTYRNDPAGFVRDCIHWQPGEGLTFYQEKILTELSVKRRVCVRGLHGIGKTALSAWLILWFALTRDGEDWKCPTTASAWRQLAKFTWPEVHKWARRIRWDKIGRAPFDERNELLTLSLKLKTGEAFAVASDTPEFIEGAHADQLFYIFDEAKAIPTATFDAAEGAFSNAGKNADTDAYAFAISTPGEPTGRFYEIQSRKPGYEDWQVIHVSLEEAMRAGRINPEWVEQRERQWGRQSSIFINRVLGEFASSEEDTVIPLIWVEKAIERWHSWRETRETGNLEAVGADIARSGLDKTVFALRYAGNNIDELRTYNLEDTMQTAGRLKGILEKHRTATAIIDIIGIGAGVYDRLREQGFRVSAFNASERSDDKDKSRELGFINKRSAAYWNLREMLDPASGEELALPPDDELIGDLTAPKWRVTGAGRIQVESKDEIKKRLGRSTDKGDAVAMAMYHNNWPKIGIVGIKPYRPRFYRDF